MQIREVSLVLLLACLAQAQTPQYVPPPAPEQPLPYSHKTHLTLTLQCRTCHEIPEPGDFATLPATAKCMICHTQIKTDSPAIQQLTEFHKNGEPVPWVPVYRIADYVFFSHKEHLSSGTITCEDCHGPVREMDQMQKVKDISMAACMDCHREKKASLGCDFCHEPI